MPNKTNFFLSRQKAQKCLQVCPVYTYFLHREELQRHHTEMNFQGTRKEFSVPRMQQNFLLLPGFAKGVIRSETESPARLGQKR